MNNKLVIDPNERHISVADLGIFNPGDFFLVDVYVTDVPESAISLDFFEGWNLEAKALDLDIKKDLGAATRGAETTEKTSWFRAIFIIYFRFMYYWYWQYTSQSTDLEGGCTSLEGKRPSNNSVGYTSHNMELPMSGKRLRSGQSFCSG